MNENPDPSPFNRLPPVVVAIALAMFGIEVVFNLGSRGLIGGDGAVGWRVDALQTYAVPGGLQAWMLETGRFSPVDLMRYVTYPFVHLSFTHMLFAAVIFLALGKMVSEVLRPWAVLIVFFGAAITGAVVYGLLGATFVLAGGYPAVFGMVGAFTYILWMRLAGTGTDRYRAFSLIGVLLLIRLIFGLLFGAELDWVAEIAGFVAGFGLSVVVSPGGWARLVERLRQR